MEIIVCLVDSGMMLLWQPVAGLLGFETMDELFAYENISQFWNVLKSFWKIVGVVI